MTKRNAMNWIRQIHSEDDKLSSKRIYGSILILTVCASAVMGKDIAILEPMLYTGAALIGLGTTVKIATALKGNNNADK